MLLFFVNRNASVVESKHMKAYCIVIIKGMWSNRKIDKANQIIFLKKKTSKLFRKSASLYKTNFLSCLEGLSSILLEELTHGPTKYNKLSRMLLFRV